MTQALRNQQRGENQFHKHTDYRYHRCCIWGQNLSAGTRSQLADRKEAVQCGICIAGDRRKRELQSFTQVTPYCYQNPDGDTITYYCCITTYVGDEPSAYFGLNQSALEQVVDMDTLENRRDCEVNGLEAIMGELNGQTYLCWTISPTYSCVLEYTAGSISEADIFRMAESVGNDVVIPD